jgi:hypothetical protein
MKKLLAIFALLTLTAHADTINSSVVIKDQSGNKVTTTAVGGKQGLDVNVITPGGSSTVNQGTPNTASNAWPMYLCNAGGVHCMAINSDGSINVDATITGSVTIANPSTNYSLETGGNLASILAKLNSSVAVTGVFFQSTQSVSAAALPLPTNAAQETGGHLASIDTKLTNPLPVSGTITTSPNVNLHDGAGNAITSQVSGSQRPLDTGINVAGVQVDPRSIRALTSSDVVSVQGGNSTAVKVDGSAVTQPVSAASLPLPSNAAQETGGHLASIDTKLTSPIAIQGGNSTAVKVDGSGVTQPVSGSVTALGPADVTPATQAITVVDSGTTSTTVANGQVLITGTCTAGACATFSLSSVEAAELLSSGSWTGTLATEVSQDCATYTSRGVKQSGVSYIANSFTGNFQGGMNTGAIGCVRVRATAAMTGTATIKATSSLNPASVIVSNPQMLRDGTTQSVTNTIKAASTAAVATDTAIVVAVSPNNTPVLPSNAAQETGGHLASIDTKLTSPISIQGGNSTAVKTDGSAVTQPISAASLPLPALAATSTKQSDGSQKSQVVDGANATVGPVTTISGTNYLPVIQASSGTPGSATPARSMVIAGSDGTNTRTLSTNTNGDLNASLGNTAGKTVVMKAGNIQTTATTSNQVILTYTVTAAKTFYLQYFDCTAETNAAAATASQFGTCSLSINGTIVYTSYQKGSGESNTATVYLAEPIPVAAGQIILWETTPAAATAYNWYTNFGGYEK